MSLLCAYSPGRETLIAFLPSWGWMKHIMWCFLFLAPPLASLRHPCPEAPAHMIQLTHEERTEPYVSVPINWCPLCSARRHCSAPRGRDHLTFAFSQHHTSEARVRQMRWMDDLLMILQWLLRKATELKTALIQGKHFPLCGSDR